MTEASRVDPAFGALSRYDEQTALFGPRRPLEDLRDALQRYQDLGCTPALGFSPGSCTWEDVEDRLIEVEREYDDKEKGAKNLLRKAVRRMGDRADTITPALNMLPDDYGLSVVSGGLAWMFLLAKNTSTRRKDILQAFKDVPRTMKNVQLKREAFAGDPILKTLSENLNDAVLESLSKMIRFLLPRYALAKVFPFFPNTPSGGEVDDVLLKVRRAQEALQERVTVLTEVAVGETNRVTKENGQYLYKNLAVSRGIDHNVRGLETEVERINKKLDLFQAQCEEERQEFQRQLWNANTNQYGIESQNYMAAFLWEMQQLYATHETKMLHMQRMIERAVTPVCDTDAWDGGVPLMTAAELLARLDVPSEGLVQDLRTVASEGARALNDGTGALLQAQGLLVADRFRQWFTSPTSDLLHVTDLGLGSGGSSNSGSGPVRISPLSVVCASIVGTLVQAKAQPQQTIVMPLYFFCGCHARTGDALAGPQGLMRSLVARLLLMSLDASEQNVFAAATAAATRLDIVRDPTLVRALRDGSGDLAALCRVFGQLVARFPPHVTIYCMIDGVSWYEQPDTAPALLLVVQTLLDFVSSTAADPSRRPTLKVLLTSPFRSRYVALNLPESQRLLLGARMPMRPDDPIQDRLMMARFMARSEQFSIGGGVPVRAAPVGVEQDLHETAEDYR